MEEKLIGLNWGQFILYGYLCNSIQGCKGFNELGYDTLVEIIDSVIELTSIKHYNDEITECPDYLIMVQPEKSFEIFCDWYDENEQYFSTI